MDVVELRVDWEIMAKKVVVEKENDHAHVPEIGLIETESDDQDPVVETVQDDQDVIENTLSFIFALE